MIRVVPTHGPPGPVHAGPVPLSVLVIDDDPAFRGVARRILVACGLVVVGEVGTAEAGSGAALSLRPDAVLVDVGLPDGDGVVLAAQLAALPWRPRVLLTSTDPDLVPPEDVARSGALGFVPKHQLPEAQLERLFMGR
jgi:DNA-binding NarL/FixJ family response regulator